LYHCPTITHSRELLCRESRRLFSEARDKTPLPAWMDSKKGGARLIKLIRDTPGCEKFVQDIDEVATETGLGLFDAGLSSANGLEQVESILSKDCIDPTMYQLQLHV